MFVVALLEIAQFALSNFIIVGNAAEVNLLTAVRVCNEAIRVDCPSCNSVHVILCNVLRSPATTTAATTTS